MLIKSANDATVTLAVGVAGSERAFVKLMNRRAGQLGLTDTHFKNSRGKDQTGHYMSARDLATLGRYVWKKYPFFRTTVATKTAVVTWPPSHRVTVTSHNRLLDYSWGDGIKTGATRQGRQGAGRVGHAERRPAHRRHHARADARPGGEGRGRAAQVGRRAVTPAPGRGSRVRPPSATARRPFLSSAPPSCFSPSPAAAPPPPRRSRP